MKVVVALSALYYKLIYKSKRESIYYLYIVSFLIYFEKKVLNKMSKKLILNENESNAKIKITNIAYIPIFFKSDIKKSL